MKNRDRTLAKFFNDPKYYNIVISLYNVLREDIVTVDEFDDAIELVKEKYDNWNKQLSQPSEAKGEKE